MRCGSECLGAAVDSRDRQDAPVDIDRPHEGPERRKTPREPQPADDAGGSAERNRPSRPNPIRSNSGQQASDRRAAEERHRVERHHPPTQIVLRRSSGGWCWSPPWCTMSPAPTMGSTSSDEPHRCGSSRTRSAPLRTHRRDTSITRPSPTTARATRGTARRPAHRARSPSSAARACSARRAAVRRDHRHQHGIRHAQRRSRLRASISAVRIGTESDT